jgi:hypothetical protein
MIAQLIVSSRVYVSTRSELALISVTSASFDCCLGYPDTVPELFENGSISPGAALSFFISLSATITD